MNKTTESASTSAKIEKEGVQIKGKDIIYLNAPEVRLSEDTPLLTDAQDLAGAINELFSLGTEGGEETDDWTIPEMPEPAPDEVYVLFDSLLNPAPEIAGKDNMIWLSLRGYKPTESIDFGDGNIFYSDSAYANGTKYTYSTSGTYLVKLKGSKEIVKEFFLYNCSDSGYGSIRAIKIGSDINIYNNDRPFTARGNTNCIGVEYIKMNHLSSATSYLFDYCHNLRKVELNNCKSLGTSAFRKCYNLNDIELPNCENVSGSGFSHCYNLKTAKLPICNTLGNFAFYSCYKLNSLNAPNCISIGSSAFESCISLKAIELPNCTAIGSMAFSNCSSLETVELPNCENIGNDAFGECSNLKSVSLPNVTAINNNTFSGCTKLESIDLPNCTSIGESAFSNCSSLKTVNLPKCTVIGEYAFENCGSLRELIIAT